MNRLALRQLISVPLTLILTLSCAVSPSSIRTQNRISIKSTELESLLDPIFAEQMAKLHIPGAVVAVVKDGKIVFTRGYGYADIEKKTPVVPDKTIFRIGSITKVFTAAAIMQLADRKRINLNDDVNKYLKSVKVPDTFPQPITFTHLLTHTSGLDEISPGRRTADRSKVIPLGEFLKTRLVRLLPPGELISYSTYNAALGGLLVEQISETPFKTYLERNVFDPLRMSHTSIAAVKPDYEQDLASGYEYDGKNHQKLPFQWFHTYPASDINSTATDMARFMLANLAGGALDGKRMLSARAMRDMHSTHFRNHPRVAGWAYGFYEGEQNNQHFVEHGGSMDDGYSALLTLVPGQNLGLFVACNTETGGFGLSEAVKTALFNHLFPVSAQPEITKPKTNQSAAALGRFAGKYRGYIYCHSCPANSGAYVPDPAELTVNQDETLSFQGEKWRQVEPLLFELTRVTPGRRHLLAFRENSKGEIIYAFGETYRVYEKIPR